MLTRDFLFADQALHTIALPSPPTPSTSTAHTRLAAPFPFVEPPSEMAPPSLPAEIIARIFELVAEPIRLRTKKAHHAYKTFVSSALVSKAFGALATEQLFRRLEVQWNDPSYGYLAPTSTRLEMALLRYEGVGRLTRTLHHDGSVRQLAFNIASEEEKASVEHSTAVYLACCPHITSLEMNGFHDHLLPPLLAQVGEKRGDLSKLLLIRTRNGLEGGMDVKTLADVLRPFPSLQSLCITRLIKTEVDDPKECFDESNQPPPISLRYLELGEYSPPSPQIHLLLCTISSFTSARILFLHAYLPVLTSLTRFEATMPLLDYLKIFLPLSATARVSLALNSASSPCRAAWSGSCEDTDLTQLPQSLQGPELFELWDTGLDFAPTMALWRQRASRRALLTPASWSWSEKENKAWDASEEGKRVVQLSYDTTLLDCHFAGRMRAMSEPRAREGKGLGSDSLSLTDLLSSVSLGNDLFITATSRKP